MSGSKPLSHPNPYIYTTSHLSFVFTLKTTLISTPEGKGICATKQGKIYKEYESLCGVRQGNNQFGLLHNAISIKQEDIAKELKLKINYLKFLSCFNIILSVICPYRKFLTNPLFIK